MAAWRFTLIGLFVALTLVALACAALTNPSPLCTWVVVTGTLGLLAYAVVAAIFRRGARRAFWIAFAIIGWGYIYLVAHDRLGFGDPAQLDRYGRLVSLDATAHLVTTDLLIRWVRYSIHRSESDDAEMPGRLFRIGQYLWALLFGALAGLVARWTYVSGERKAERQHLPHRTE